MPLNDLIDTHAHLDFDQFDPDREEVILRAHENGIQCIINIGTDLPTSQYSVRLAENHKNIYAAVGIHPHDSHTVTPEVLDEISRLFQHQKTVAIGEIGLDYFKMYQPIDLQERAFQKQIELALDLKAPIIIHSRSTDVETVEMLRNYQKKGWKGVFHCFPGDTGMADAVLEMGFHVSFTGNITFKNSKSIPVVQHIPLERLLLETDCPFMTPVPHRGKRNEPAYVHFVGQKIAEIKELPFETVARQTTENAVNLFHLNPEEKNEN
jgi:TatD DNase family protein